MHDEKKPIVRVGGPRLETNGLSFSQLIEKYYSKSNVGDPDAEPPTQWRDISTAPSGVVVLTNCGSAIKESNQWYLCDTDGNVPCCMDYGNECSEINPTHWGPYPEPPNKDA